MFLWLNGAFGVGKTTTAGLIREAAPRWRIFDPEQVGYMLKANLGDVAIGDFQNWRAWRNLVPRVAREIVDLTGDHLIAVQTVLVENYWKDLQSGLAELDLKAFHVVLEADEETLRQRIRGDDKVRELIAAGKIEPAGEQWRLNHIAAYQAARPWLIASADLVIDGTRLTPDEVAATVLEAVS